jgi:hypothetical protein
MAPALVFLMGFPDPTFVVGLLAVFPTGTGVSVLSPAASHRLFCDIKCMSPLLVIPGAPRPVVSSPPPYGLGCWK